MIRAVKGTNFLIGSFVDAMTPENQRTKDVRCVLKCTHQLIQGSSEKRFDFHHKDGYFNLPFRDDGGCDVAPGANAFLMVKDWMRGAEGIIKAEGKGKILVHSWSGMGKAVRLVAAHLCGWIRSQYKNSLARVYKSADIPKTLQVDLPAFEAALVDALDADPEPKKAAVGVAGADDKPKRRGRRPRRPKLD